MLLVLEDQLILMEAPLKIEEKAKYYCNESQYAIASVKRNIWMCKAEGPT